MRAPKCRICGAREHNHECTGEGVHGSGNTGRGVRQWREDIDAAGEPVEVQKGMKKARFYAPPGECVYCDRRRRAAAKTMAALRERGEGYA